METWCIDRIEGASAICEREDGSWETIPREQLPPEAREGDVLTRGDQGAFVVDVAETERRRAEIQALEDALFRD